MILGWKHGLVIQKETLHLNELSLKIMNLLDKNIYFNTLILSANW